MTKSIKYNFSELVDKLSIIQIKQVINNKQYRSYENTISKILNELELNISKNKKMILNSKIVNLLNILSQINLFIWFLRDEMQISKKNYKQNMKLSHQLNALRNITKNKLLLIFNKNKNQDLRTNIDKEDLKGWKFSFLNEK